MSGTARTQNFLLTSLFQDGQPAGSITPSDERDLIVSMPMPNIVRAPFRPDFPPYNAKFDGTTDDTTAWKSMFTDIASRGWGEVILPGGTSLVQGGQITIPTQCKIRGQGMGSTTVQRLNSSSTGLIFDMSGANNTSPLSTCILEDFTISGLGAYNGGLLRMIYGSNHYVNRMQFFGTNDFAMQMVQVWDSIFTNCRVLNCAQNQSATAYTSSQGVGGGSTIGSEAIQILGAIAASGFGSSADSSNQLRFRDTVIETFYAGAIAQCNSVGTSSGTSSHSILFSGLKLETNNLTGPVFINQSDDVKTTRFEYTYCGYQGSSGTNVGSQQIIYNTCNEGHIVQFMIVNLAANGLQSVVKTWQGNGGEINNIKMQGGSNTLTKAVIWAASGTLPGPNTFGVAVNTSSPTSIPSIYNDTYTVFHSGA